jgi:hypothetical protein
MKRLVNLLFLASLILLSLNGLSRAEDKFITIKDYIKTRSNPTDPYVNYIVNLRCAIVFQVINEVSGKNNMPEAAANAKQTSEKFIDISTKYQSKANVSTETSVEDIKRYYKIYENRLLQNYAVTGNYFDEPIYVEDLAICKSLL